MNLEAPIPPQIEISNISKHPRGGSDSKIEILILSDFDCPSCQQHYKLFNEIYELFKDEVDFSYVPLSTNPSLSIIFSECAAKQGKFWEMHDLIYTTLPKDTSDYLKLAKHVGLDVKQIDSCLKNNSEIQEMLKTNLKTLSTLGLTVTPTLIVDRRVYYGDLELDKLKSYLDKVLNNF